MSALFLHHRVATAPRRWGRVAEAIGRAAPSLSSAGGTLWGVWRSQIGRPRDELTVLTRWDEGAGGQAAWEDMLGGISEVAGGTS